ncbi:hypothetical protein ACFYXS_35740 [Streptomyces sp. NPDC002574]|uniref:hypothetical protein n=1 Tax=Streptomyces sp. NPDC002574 TaxID=3364652 RepID=UPI0036AB0849
MTTSRPGRPLERGFTNAWKLWEEIVSLGYKGSYQRVRAYLHKKRTSPPPVTARPPSPRTVSGWILRHPETHVPILRQTRNRDVG